MKTFAQKYTIISLLEDAQEGYCYSCNDWPLHITFVDTFAVDWNVATIIQKLDEAVNKMTVTSTKAVGDDYFGKNKETHVILLENNSEMIKTHSNLIKMLAQGNLRLNDPQYSKEGFIHHSTVQKYTAVKLGEEVKIDNLALIDMFPANDPYQRKVLKIAKIN